MKVLQLSGTCLSYYLPGDKVLIDAGAYTSEKVEVLILTHCHCDHFTHAARIIREQKPEVYAGAHDVKALKNMSEEVIPGMAQNLTPIIAKPLKEGMEVRGLKVFETPGHTKGSIVLLKNGFLFTGDTLFKDNFGRTDLPSGNWSEMIESLDRINKLPFKQLMPGH